MVFSIGRTKSSSLVFSVGPVLHRLRLSVWVGVALCYFFGQSALAQSQQSNTPSEQASERVEATANFPRAWEGIVRVETANLRQDYRAPWDAGRPGGGTGTAWLIGKNKFLTNAHVVANATRLLIRLPRDPRPYEARVLFVAHDCDLALIEAVDAESVKGLVPLALGGIPQLNTEVVAVGYPVGGERLSVTRGVVSRIDFRSYAHTSIDAHLTVQIDAAINPGNSGGPVLQNGKVVGVAFQGINGAAAQNVAYMIPVPVVQRFMKDISDGQYDHYVDLAISTFPLENQSQRKALGLTNDGLGVLVTSVLSEGASSDKVKVGDVLLKIDNTPVLSNGLIQIDGELVNLAEVAERKFAGDKVKFHLLRDGKLIDLQITLKRFLPSIVLGNQYEERLRYVMYAGLLFQPLSRDLINAYNIKDQQVTRTMNDYLDRELYKEFPEIVLLTNVLPDQVNSYLSVYRHSVVEQINGVKITRLSDLPDALQRTGTKPGFIEIKLKGVSRPVVLNRLLAQRAHPAILNKYGIQSTQYLGN